MKLPLRPRPVRLLLVILALARAHAAEPPAFELLYGGKEIFPSMLVSLTGDSRYAPGELDAGEKRIEEPLQRGDRHGVIAIRVVNPAPNTRVTVHLERTLLYEASTLTEVLPEAGKTYYLAPSVTWEYEKLATLKQPIANFMLRARVQIAAEAHEIYLKTVVHSVNDWLYQYKLRNVDGFHNSAKYLVAAYVNENHPLIEREITKRATEPQGGSEAKVGRFVGYTGTADPKGKFEAVDPKEVKAVFEVVREMGFRYTLLSQPSYVARSEGPAAVQVQSLRMVGDMFAARQVSSTEAAVLLASVYRKLGLQVALIFVKEQNASRGEALLGISMIKSGGKGNPTRDELRSNLLVLDTSQIGTFSYETAVANGAAKFRDPKHAGNLSFIAHFDAEPGDAMRRVAEMQGYFWIDLARARADGVLPIPEFDFPSARR